MSSRILDGPRLRYPGPRPSGGRNGAGNGRGEWDWFYALSTSEQARCRYYMAGNGCEPDEWAAAMDFDDVEAAMDYWRGMIAEIRAERDEWAEPEPEPEGIHDDPDPLLYVDEMRTKLDLVGPHEIADRAGVTRSAVTQWRSRHKAFPEPLATIGGARRGPKGGSSAGTPVWDWRAVEKWLVKTGRYTRPSEV